MEEGRLREIENMCTEAMKTASPRMRSVLLKLQKSALMVRRELITDAMSKI